MNVGAFFIRRLMLVLMGLSTILLFQNCGTGFNTVQNLEPSLLAQNSVVDDPLFLSFASNKISLVSGESASLQFSATGAVELILNPGAINVTGMTIYNVNPTATTEYTLVAKNKAGSTLSKSVSIVVTEALPVISNFSASNLSITSGQSSVLSWSVSGATQLSLDPGNVNVTAMSSLTVSPTATVLYTLKATNSGGSVTKTLTVTVNAAPPPVPTITSFTSSAASIVSGQSATLSWVVSGASTLTLNPGNINVTGKTSQLVAPTANTTYTLVATNVSGSVNKTVAVVVTQPVPLPVISSFTSSVLAVQSGESATLSWVSTGATSLKLDPGNIDLAGKTNQVVSPTANTTYTLTATNATGSVTKTLSILFISPWIINPAPSFTFGSNQTLDLSLTLPAGIVKGGTFAVSATGSPLPAGMTLAANGILSVGSAAVGDTLNVSFEYTEP